MSMIRGSDSCQESRPWQVKVPTKFAGRMYGELVHEFLKERSALCIGLYRQRFPAITGASGPGYVITNPLGSAVLQADDLVMVLGNDDFGQRCYSEGLLANTDTSWERAVVKQVKRAAADQATALTQSQTTASTRKSKPKKLAAPGGVKAVDDGKKNESTEKESHQDIADGTQPGSPSKSTISQMQKMQQPTASVRVARSKKKGVASHSS